ncbi:MAG: Peptidyl-prolyl cis-trans isomerase, partial [uncultured Solirubrobacteraceae bacterium]
ASPSRRHRALFLCPRARRLRRRRADRRRWRRRRRHHGHHHRDPARRDPDRQRLQAGQEAEDQEGRQGQAPVAEDRREEVVHRDARDELRRHRDRPRRQAGPEDRRVVRRARAQGLLRRPRLPPDRPGFRRPGRRPRRHRQRRARLRRHRDAPVGPQVLQGRRGHGQDGDGRARHVGQPVLHRHRRRRGPAARLRAARQGHQGRRRGQEDRGRPRRGRRPADRAGRDLEADHRVEV